MTITTKYLVGEKVFILNCKTGKVQELEVRNVNTYQHVLTPNKIEITYGFKIDKDISDEYISEKEDKVFKTKQELIDSL